jgi:RHS repeat-associated protein
VHSPERTIAIVTRGGAEPGTKFLHVDHLGSIETITNDAGARVEKRSNDAFGARRNPEWGGPAIPFTSKTKKGFTGHEEDEEFGLVNMKGRLYDPKIGRFTTTDPVIADVSNGQSFGAYSYVLNNPLTLVDPSGFEAKTLPITPIDSPDSDGITPEEFIDLVLSSGKGQPQETSTPEANASVGASAPPVDMSTTGSGGDGLPQNVTKVEKGSTGDAAWDGLGDMGQNLWHYWTSPGIEPVLDMYDAYEQGGARGALDVVNPLVGLESLTVALNEGDDYTVTRQTVAIGGTVVVSLLMGAAWSKVTGGGGGKAGSGKGQTAGQRVNMPAWRRIAIDMEEVSSGHMQSGWRLSPGNNKDLFPSTMSRAQVERAIRHAYRNGEVLHSQGAEKVFVRGPFGNGRIEMWVNKKTKLIETAWPKF